MENYVRLRANNGLGQVTQYKTKIVEGDKEKNIVWNETFSVPVKPSSSTVFEFTVLDQDNTSDDVCGVGLFKLEKCGVFNSGATQKYNIRLFAEKEEEITGSLHVTTRFS